MDMKLDPILCNRELRKLVTTVRERRSIRFTLYQFFSTESHDYCSIILWINERVVLFSCNASQRLEPVSIVSSTLFDSPFFHSMSNNVCYIKFKWSTIIKCLFKCFESFFWKTIFHNLLVEYHASKQFRNVYHNFVTPNICLLFFTKKKAM